MKTIAVPPVPAALNPLSPKAIATLAEVYDEASHAITLYFSRPNLSDKAHRGEALTFEHLIKTARDRYETHDGSPGLSKDLARILSMEPEFRGSPRRFHAVFACKDRDIWQVVDLPTCGDLSGLQVSQRFQMVPLLRALEATTPCCVALVERGKARVFLVRGTDALALPLLPTADLAVEADDSRVGWSDHIDGSVRERTKAYFKSLALDLHLMMLDLSCGQLVVGCREDVWSELEPQLVKAGMTEMMSGRFHLTNLDMTTDEIAKATKPVVREKLRQQYVHFWELIRERPEISAVGVDAVLRRLEAGSVQALFLGDLAGKDVTACSICQSWWNVGTECPACGSRQSHPVSAEEFLVRRALATGARIIAPDLPTADLFAETGALLRY